MGNFEKAKMMYRGKEYTVELTEMYTNEEGKLCFSGEAELTFDQKVCDIVSEGIRSGKINTYRGLRSANNG